MLVVTASCAFLAGASGPTAATLEISHGKITAIHHELRSSASYGAEVDFIDTGEAWLLPGLVDAHVHLNEPGRTEWEGFATGSSAGAAGGVTTIVDMPLNAIPPTTNVHNLSEKVDAAAGQCRVDVAFWGGVIPGNEDDLIPLVKAGVKGFKCFLIESGVDEFPCVNEAEVMTAMAKLDEANSLLLFHAELDPVVSPPPAVGLDPTSYSTFLASRPESLETSAIALVARCAAAFPNLRTHIVHLSAASALPLLRQTRASGLPMTVETCFHYLTLSAEQIAKGTTLHKCCPPIRESINRDLLWQALLDGDIDFVVSDHSPCTLELKNLEEGNFMSSWGGISGLGLGLSLLWTEAGRRGIGMARVLEWVAERPAKQIGMEGVKGSLCVGADADFVLFDPVKQFVVDKSSLHFKNRSSPYEGMLLTGVVGETYLRGQKVYDRSTGFEGLSPIGKLIL